MSRVEVYGVGLFREGEVVSLPYCLEREAISFFFSELLGFWLSRL